LIFKNAKTNIHCTAPREILGLRTNFDLGALVIPSSNTVVRGPGATLRKNFEICGPRNGQILHSGSLVDSYIYVYFTVILYLGPPLTCPKANCTPLGGVDSTCSYNYLSAVTTIYDSIVSYSHEENKYFRLGE
jgi:hypothetical protein